MSPDKLEHYRQVLLRLRGRVVDGASHLVQSIQEDEATNENLSSVPVHLADVAPESVDADVQILETEQRILDDITDALNRIGDGTFGQCQSCSREISEQRLKAIPYAPLCIECAKAAAGEGA